MVLELQLLGDIGAHLQLLEFVVDSVARIQDFTQSYEKSSAKMQSCIRY